MATSLGPPDSGSETNTASGPSARLRPARAWYWVALGVFLAGVAWAAIMFAVLIGRVDSFQRVPDPGSGVISLTHSGGYVIYYEGPGASSGNVPNGNVHVTPASESTAVQSIGSYSGSLTYHFGHHEGTAVATLQIVHPGRFLVTATSSTAPPGSHVAIGSSIAGGILVIVIPALLLMLAGIGAASTIAIIRHSRAKRARLPLTQLTGGPAAGTTQPVTPTGHWPPHDTQSVPPPDAPPTAPTQSWPPPVPPVPPDAPTQSGRSAPPVPPAPPDAPSRWQELKSGRSRWYAGLGFAAAIIATVEVYLGLRAVWSFRHVVWVGVLGLVFGFFGRRYQLGKAAIAFAVVAVGFGIAGPSIVDNGAKDVNTADTSSLSPSVAPTETTPNVPTTEEPTPTPPASHAPPVKSIPGSINITQDDQPAGTLAVASVKSTRKSNVDYGLPPANGYFVTFTVRVNSTIDGLGIGALDFYTVLGGRHYDAGNGNVYEGVNTNNELSYTTLNAGEHTQGTICFDLPSPHGQLQYAPIYQGATSIAIWKY